MSLLITGTVGLDDVSTPFGEVKGVLGGTAVYSAVAAAFYGPVRVVAAVGDDFPAEHRTMLESRRIDLEGLEVRAGSKTFRWAGSYIGDMNAAETLDTQLNVIAEEGPKVPAAYADSTTVFLANTHPTLQRTFLDQLADPKIVVCDTMNLWIENERESLLKTLARVNGVILNDGEARMLTERINLIDAGEVIRGYGPRWVIIKKGEHGAVLICEEGVVAMPAWPTKDVRDPTGAGDSFAGGLLGHLNQMGRDDMAALKQAMVRGTVAASFNIEDFSLRRFEKLSQEELKERIAAYVAMLRVE